MYAVCVNEIAKLVVWVLSFQ